MGSPSSAGWPDAESALSGVAAEQYFSIISVKNCTPLVSCSSRYTCTMADDAERDPAWQHTHANHLPGNRRPKPALMFAFSSAITALSVFEASSALDSSALNRSVMLHATTAHQVPSTDVLQPNLSLRIVPLPPYWSNKASLQTTFQKYGNVYTVHQ